MAEQKIEDTSAEQVNATDLQTADGERNVVEGVETTEVPENSSSDHGERSEEEAKSKTDSEKVQTRVKRVGLAALVLSFGILLSRLLGFVRDAVIAYQAGAGAATDAYNAAFTLPDLMNYFLAGGTMSITFIPLFAAYMAKNETERANRLFSLIATTMGSILTVAIIVCMVFTPQLCHLLFPGFDAKQVADTVEMTRIVLPGQIFHYIGSLMMACLMARGVFLPSAMAPLIYNALIILGGVVLYPIIGMKGFSVGALVGAFLGPFLMPLLFLRKKVAYKPVIDFKDADFKKYILLTLPLMVGVSLTTVDEWIGRYIGSNMDVGSISHLNYARRLMLVPIAIVGQAAGQAALPYLSQLCAKGEYAKAADTLHTTLRNVILLSCAMIGFFVILGPDMVSFVYERGQFSASDAARSGMLLQILSISIIFWTVQMVSVRAFYAAQNTLHPMLISTVVTLLSLPIYWGLSEVYGLAGLAAASVIGMAGQASATVLFYHGMNKSFKPSHLLKSLLLGIPLFLAAGGGSYGGLWVADQMQIFTSPSWKALWNLGWGGCCGLILALCVARFIIPDAFKSFTNKVLRKLHLRRG